jgi:hypothetical protein
MGDAGHTIPGTERGDTAPPILNLDARWGVDEQHHNPAVLPLGKGNAAHITGRWLGLMAGLEGHGGSKYLLLNGVSSQTVQLA